MELMEKVEELFLRGLEAADKQLDAPRGPA